jgi:hypothetical protein
MAFLANPVISIGGVNLTGFCTAASVLERYDALEDTTFGMTARESQAGLGNHEATVTLYMDYSDNATYEVLSQLVGTKCEIIATPASGANSPTNPGFTLSDTLLAELPVLSATLGELQTIDITFVQGQLTIDIS